MTPRRGTILLAVYEPDLRLLTRQVNSLKQQTLRDWDCLIGFDGEQPGVMGSLQDAIGGDCRFQVLAYENRVGFYRNFERLLAATPETSAWAALCDQDDEWHPDKLAVLTPLLQRFDLAMGQARVVTRHGVLLRSTHRRESTLTALLVDNQVTGSMSVASPELIRRSLPFPPATDVSYHDHWMGICAVLGRGIVVVDRELQDYVQHEANVVGEELSRRWGSRVARLRRQVGSRSLVVWTRYVSQHRWGWRVLMAREAARRFPDSSRSDQRQLARFTQGRLNPGLLFALMDECLRGRTPWARSVGLVIGALAWRPEKEGHVRS